MKKGGRNLSASALMNYCSCQLKFYYKNVVGISDDIEAAEYIETQSAQVTVEDWSCTMLESLFDGGTFTVSIGVSGGEKYIIIPDYCGPGDDVSEIGLPSGQTLGDYAAQQGKTLLCVSGDINDHCHHRPKELRRVRKRGQLLGCRPHCRPK